MNSLSLQCGAPALGPTRPNASRTFIEYGRGKNFLAGISYEAQHVGMIDVSHSDQLENALSLQEELANATSVEDIISAVHDAIILMRTIDEESQYADIERDYCLEDMRAILSKRMQIVIIPKVFATLWEKVKEECRKETTELSAMKQILESSPCSDANDYQIILERIAEKRQGYSEYRMDLLHSTYDAQSVRQPIAADAYAPWKESEIQRITRRIAEVDAKFEELKSKAPDGFTV